MKVGQVFRYSRPYSEKEEIIDNLTNFFFVTNTPGKNKALLESGINPIKAIKHNREFRIPAILTRSSPHKVGSSETPWDDIYDFENGHIRYYGDNKNPNQAPENAPGNKVLLEQFYKHGSLDIIKRQESCPLLFFKSVQIHGKVKGYVKFFGFGIIQRVELITQFDRASNKFFSNYVFDFAILNLKKENQVFNWKWIQCRRDSTLLLKDTEKFAPYAWKEYIKKGPSSIHRLKYRFSKLLTVKPNDQIPKPGSTEEKVLQSIYNFYTNTSKKLRFEALAEEVVAEILNSNGGSYTKGWVTIASGDGGKDFVGRLDLGREFATAKLIVIGQAKCEKLDTPTNGNHIARTVARLKRGWLGAYVTTSFYSESVQNEIIEDEYPILLVNGLMLAKTVKILMQKEAIPNISKYLTLIDKSYLNRLQDKQPEEILYDFN